MSYILIISDETDLSTNHVIDWLSSTKQRYIRVNDTDILNISKFNINDKGISIQFEFEFFGKSKTFFLNEISSVWYRRGELNLNFQYFLHKNKSMQNGINKYHINEKTNIENFIYQYLLNKKHINSFFDNYTNKLYNLFVASSVGLKIPSTTITTNKLTIIHEINTHKKMITKAITEGSIRFSPNSGIGYHTCLIENKNLLTMPDNFSRSLIQPCIDKAYELRIFYLDNDFYPMAIFSQNDEQTKIDFRNYNYAKPNRTVPYNLPIEIKDKLIEFVKKIEINSGSIDIVVSKSNDFYFLEVNPIGQFQQLSTPCNYYIEKKIAHYLQ